MPARPRVPVTDAGGGGPEHGERRLLGGDHLHPAAVAVAVGHQMLARHQRDVVAGQRPGAAVRDRHHEVGVRAALGVLRDAVDEAAQLVGVGVAAEGEGLAQGGDGPPADGDDQVLEPEQLSAREHGQPPAGVHRRQARGPQRHAGPGEQAREGDVHGRGDAERAAGRRGGDGEASGRVHDRDPGVSVQKASRASAASTPAMPAPAITTRGLLTDLACDIGRMLPHAPPAAIRGRLPPDCGSSANATRPVALPGGAASCHPGPMPASGRDVLTVNAGSTGVKLGLVDARGAHHADLRPRRRCAVAARGGGPPRGLRRRRASWPPCSWTTRVLEELGRPQRGGAAAQRAGDRADPQRARRPSRRSPTSPCSTPPSTRRCRRRPRTYAVPERWRDEWDVRRYGFHGLSVEWARGAGGGDAAAAARSAAGRLPPWRRRVGHRGARAGARWTRAWASARSRGW